MGCDIHGYIEIKKDGIWHALEKIKMPRDYKLFSSIAYCGRNEGYGPPIAPNKGLPEDLSLIAKLVTEFEADDSHSHTWLNIDEILEIEKLWIESISDPGTYRRTFYPFGFLFGNGFEPIESPDWYGPQVDDVRAVVWFDN